MAWRPAYAAAAARRACVYPGPIKYAVVMKYLLQETSHSWRISKNVNNTRSGISAASTRPVERANGAAYLRRNSLVSGAPLVGMTACRRK